MFRYFNIRNIKILGIWNSLRKHVDPLTIKSAKKINVMIRQIY